MILTRKTKRNWSKLAFLILLFFGLGVLLPLFLSAASSNVDCSTNSVRNQITKFKNPKSVKSAQSIIISCKHKAVLPLELALSDSNDSIRAHSANTLGLIGLDAQSALPTLVMALPDQNDYVKESIFQALVKIGREVQNQEKIFFVRLNSIENLQNTISIYEEAIEILKADDQGQIGDQEKLGDIILIRNGLKTRLKYLEGANLLYVVDWVVKSPLFLPFIIVLSYLLFFAVKPLWLLKLDDIFKALPTPAWSTSFLRALLLLKFNPWVLDAWIKQQLLHARKEFSNRNTVDERSIHIRQKVLIGGEAKDADEFGPKLFQQIFSRPPVRIVVVGEGGSGKTSIACQLGWWAMAENKDERLCKHVILPVMIESEISSSLLESVEGELERLIGRKVPQDLIIPLLRRGRLMIIVDHLSEMSPETQAAFRLDNKDFPCRFLVVTSRNEKILDPVRPVLVEPFRIQEGDFAQFLQPYIEEKLRSKKLENLVQFDSLDYSEAYDRLGQMAYSRQVSHALQHRQGITLLLVKLYADQMIQCKAESSIDDPPDNIPRLFLEYVNDLNSPRKITQDHIEHEVIQVTTSKIAWCCLRENLKPSQVQLNVVVDELSRRAWKEEVILHDMVPMLPGKFSQLQEKDQIRKLLEYLEEKLTIVRLDQVDGKNLRFNLDPLAEYLASIYIVRSNTNDEEKWQKFIEEMDEKVDSDFEQTQGFITALRECCERVGKPLGTPDWVINSLGNKINLDTSAIEKFQRQRRVRKLREDLSAPEPDFRKLSAEYLAKFGRDAVPTVPKLFDLLHNSSEKADVRREAARTLRILEKTLSFNQPVPTIVPTVLEGEESLSLIQPPLIENILLDEESGLSIEMIQIPEGEFFMGSDANELDSKDDEHPLHSVFVKSFWMSKYPITQLQWKTVVEKFGKVKMDLQAEPSEFSGENHPVENISWYEASEFCFRLSSLNDYVLRLPSEAEWEYACRAGTRTPFHLGDTISSDLSNYNANFKYGLGSIGTNRGRTTSVGILESANSFGLYEMHGNVYEWCLDFWHESYQDAPNHSEPWLENRDNSSRIVRGGSWLQSPKECRSAHRNNFLPDTQNNETGFRVVASYL